MVLAWFVLLELWFRFGSALVQLCVACLYMVQLWFRIDAVLVQLAGGRGWCDLVQLGFRFGAVVCGLIWFSLVQRWYSLLWSLVLWIGFGSVLIQLWLRLAWPDVLWISCGSSWV